MRTRRRYGLAAVATAATLALVLTSCGGGGGNGEVVGADRVGAGVNNIKPLPRDQLRDGGDLSWPLDAIPDNFNALHIDGALVDNVKVIGALMPSAFVVQPDASVTVNQNYFTAIELTGQNPQRITYTINPKAVWNDGTPPHLAGPAVAVAGSQRHQQGVPGRQHHGLRGHRVRRARGGRQAGGGDSRPELRRVAQPVQPALPDLHDLGPDNVQ